MLSVVGEVDLVVTVHAKRTACNHCEVIGVGRMVEVFEISEAGSLASQFREKLIAHCGRVVLVFQDDDQYALKMFTGRQDGRLAVFRLQAAAGEGRSAGYEECRYANFR